MSETARHDEQIGGACEGEKFMLPGGLWAVFLIA